MTRVSDRAEFAAAVAEGGALPFLALALMRGAEVGRRCWHGPRSSPASARGAWASSASCRPSCAPSSSRSVRAHRPPFALIAGGRPDQARELEAEGIATYLHVPSPGLLRLYLARRGAALRLRGPRVRRPRRPAHQLRALGHDDRRAARGAPTDASRLPRAVRRRHPRRRSAAMVAAAAAAAGRARRPRRRADRARPTCSRARRPSAGAITPLFQERAIAAVDTVLLESGPGHATRCLPSPFVEQFEAERLRLRAAGVDAEELRGRLEQLNIGRLRIAAKGVDRDPEHAADPTQPRLRRVDVEQWEQGMYMIGQVAALRGRGHDHRRAARATSARGSTELLAALPGARARSARPRRRRPRPTSRSSGSAASCPARPTSRRSGRTSSTRSTRSARSRPSAGTGDAIYDADPRATRQGLLALGRLPRRGPVRPDRARDAAEVARIDRAVPAAGAARAPRPPWPTPATRRGRSTASAPRSSSAPAAAAPTCPSATRSARRCPRCSATATRELQRAALRAAARSGPRTPSPGC